VALAIPSYRRYAAGLGTQHNSPSRGWTTFSTASVKPSRSRLSAGISANQDALAGISSGRARELRTFERQGILAYASNKRLGNQSVSQCRLRGRAGSSSDGCSALLIGFGRFDTPSRRSEQLFSTWRVPSGVSWRRQRTADCLRFWHAPKPRRAATRRCRP